MKSSDCVDKVIFYSFTQDWSRGHIFKQKD